MSFLGRCAADPAHVLTQIGTQIGSVTSPSIVMSPRRHPQIWRRPLCAEHRRPWRGEPGVDCNL